MDEKPKTKPMDQVIQIDKARIQRLSWRDGSRDGREVLNAMLDAEADRLEPRRGSPRSQNSRLSTTIRGSQSTQGGGVQAEIRSSRI